MSGDDQKDLEREAQAQEEGPRAPLTLTQYQRLSERTMRLDDPDALVNFCLGLAGEAGELIDIIKKYRFHGHELSQELVEKEAGDTLFYLAGICSVLGLDLGPVGERNIEKLKRRYPNGFSEEASRNRQE